MGGACFRYFSYNYDSLHNDWVSSYFARLMDLIARSPKVIINQKEFVMSMQHDQNIEPLSAMAERLKPLFPGLLGIEWTKLEPDHVQAKLLVRMELCTAGNSLHGGAFMALADTVGAVATFIQLPKGARTTTIESKTNFLRGAPIGSYVHADTRPLHRGRTTHVWETRITDEAGKLCALVIQTQMLLYEA